MKDGCGACFQDSLDISIRCQVDLKLDVIDLGLRRKMVFRSSWRDCREKLTTKGIFQEPPVRPLYRTQKTGQEAEIRVMGQERGPHRIPSHKLKGSLFECGQMKLWGK